MKSRQGQDDWVLEICGDNGFYVDIGADDGIQYSNTFELEQKSWEGICVEPRRVPFEKLVKARSCICENVCISNICGKVDFVEINDPDKMCLSGMKSHLPGGSKRRKLFDHTVYKIDAITLVELLNKHSIKQVDYISIDVEGAEWMILKEFPFRKFGIKAITIENNGKIDQFRRLLVPQGYVLEKVVAGDGFWKIGE